MSSKTSPSTTKATSRKPRQSSRKTSAMVNDGPDAAMEPTMKEEASRPQTRSAGRRVTRGVAEEASPTEGKKRATPRKTSRSAPVETAGTEDAPAAAPVESKARRQKRTAASAVNDAGEKLDGPTAETGPTPKRRRRRETDAQAADAVDSTSDTHRGAKSMESEVEEDAATTSVRVQSVPKAPSARRTRARKAAPSPADDDVTARQTIEESKGSTPLESPSNAPVIEEPPLPDFDTLGLSAPLLKAIDEIGYKTPTPIQARAIPFVLQKRDVLGVAQTGTGKTASFTLPMLELLAGSRARARMPRSLVLEPTRELALQVSENLTLYGKHLKLNHALLIGGESMIDQRAVLNQGVDILIATPGRLIDLFDRGGLLLNQAGILVIDEADRMLDMGFIPDIQRIVSLLPLSRQTLFFSATMAPEIRSLADQFLVNPEEITVSRPSSVATTIEEALIIVEERDKRRVLRSLLKRENVQNAIVFCNRKRDVDVLYKSLHNQQFSVGHLHGDLPQATRFKTLERFKNGEIKILVCSDVAARGIDIGGLSHVFNFDLPFNAEDYVHRIGRTGRAGRTGHAFSLATPAQKPLLDAIEALTHKKLPEPDLDGLDKISWGEPQDRPGRRGNSGRSGQKERKADESDKRERPSAATSSQIAPTRDLRRRSGRHERELLPMEAEHEGPGFGATLPSFMNAPRRVPPARIEDESPSGPSLSEE